MLLKNTIGIIIILLNLAGLSMLIYTGTVAFIKKRKKLKILESKKKGSVREAKPRKAPSDKRGKDKNTEGDLLKDMDLSDLDDIDLDDFK